MSEAITPTQHSEREPYIPPAPISLKGKQEAFQPPADGAVAAKDKSDHWMVRAACRGLPGVEVYFYPPSGRHELKEDKLERERQAKKVCGGCAVQQVCLDYALRIREQHGIWGGKTESERRTMLTRRSSKG